MGLERTCINVLLAVGLAAGTSAATDLNISAADLQCKNAQLDGKKFHEVVNWHDEGNTGLKGSVYDLYPVYLDGSGKIIEEGEVSGYYWVMGADGKRVYFEIDACQLQSK